MQNIKLQFKISKLFLILSILGLIAAGCNQQAVKNPPVIEAQGEQSIQIRQKVEGDMGDNLFNIYPSENKTALDLLKMGHAVETKPYSGIVGEYVATINGQKETPGKNFWVMYVNGKQSTIGADTYKPVNKDYIEWKLETIK
jgi:hypothetical protein